MNEKQIFDRLINVLNEHNLRQGRDYLITEYHHGCFHIRICPHRYATIDIHYIYDRIPDIKVFKIKQNRDVLTLVLKIKVRSC